jgi:hypothetical protein
VPYPQGGALIRGLFFVGLPPPVLGAVGGNDWRKLIGCSPNDDVSNCSGVDRNPCRGEVLRRIEEN